MGRMQRLLPLSKLNPTIQKDEKTLRRLKNKSVRYNFLSRCRIGRLKLVVWKLHDESYYQHRVHFTFHTYGNTLSVWLFLLKKYGNENVQLIHFSMFYEKFVNSSSLDSVHNISSTEMKPRILRRFMVFDCRISNIRNSWLERNFCLFLFHISISLPFDIIRTDSEILLQITVCLKWHR